VPTRLALASCVFLLLAGAASAAQPRLRPVDRDAIRGVLTRYIPAVLERRDLRLGYALSGPQVRGSTTVADWLRGEVPVYPFPARGGRVGPRDWTLTYVEPADVGLDLLIQPRPGTRQPAIAFRIQMTKIRGAWRVNAFYPEATFDTQTAKVFSPQDATGNGATPQQPRQRISGSWLALPAGLIAAAVVLGPLGYLLAARRRDRRAYRAYLDQTGG
jgi:hypothetical protein